MNQLQQVLQERFPEKFNEETWKSLIPEFIQTSFADYESACAEYDRVTAENHPRLSQSVVDACVSQAKEKGLTYEGLAVQVVAMQRQLDRQKAQQSGPQVLQPIQQLFQQFRGREEPKTMQDFLFDLSNLIEDEAGSDGSSYERTFGNPRHLSTS